MVFNFEISGILKLASKTFIMKSSVLTSGDILTVKASPSNTKINKNLIQEAVENAIGGK